MKLKIKFLEYYPEILFFLVFLLLLAAFILQYFFGFLPCKLCKIQRLPYYAIFALGLLYFLTVRKYKMSFVLISLTLLLSVAIISFYHAGIEYGFFKNILNCEAGRLIFADVTELKNYLEKRISVSCNEPAFKFIFSLSGWNFIISFSLIIYGLFFVKKYRRII